MTELFVHHYDGHDTYPKFLSPSSTWKLESFQYINAEDIWEHRPERGTYEGLDFHLPNGLCLDTKYYIYRNTKTKRLMTTEDACVFTMVNESWRDPARSGGASGIHWYGTDELRAEFQSQLDCAYSESGYSPGYNDAAFAMLKDALEQSPWEENDDYTYFFISGNGGVEGVYMKVWDVEKQQPSDIVRWWMNSDVLLYIREQTSMAKYDELEYWEEDLFQEPESNFSPDFNPDDNQHYMDHCQTEWRRSLEWAFDQSWWSTSAHELEESDQDSIVDHLSYDDLMIDNGGTNEYFVQYTYSRTQAMNWLSPLVAAMFGQLAPLADIDEDEFLTEVSAKYGNREYILKAWRKFYEACLTIEEPFRLSYFDLVLRRSIPRLSWEAEQGIRVGRGWGRRNRKADIRFYEEWPAWKIVKMTETLTALVLKHRE